MQLCLATGFWAVAGKTLQRKCFESWAVLDTMQVRHTAGRERHSTLSGLQISVCCDSGSWLAEILCPRND